MNKIAVSLLALTSALAANAGHIKINGAQPAGSYSIAEYDVKDFRTIRSDSPSINTVNATFDSNGSADFTTSANGPRVYVVVNYSNTGYQPLIFANPDDEITVTYSGDSPYPVVTGTPLMEAVAKAQLEANNLQREFMTYCSRSDVSDDSKRAAYAKYFDDLVPLAEANADNPASVYLMQLMAPAGINEVFDKIQPQAYDNLFRPLYEDTRTRVTGYREHLAAKERIAPGKPAPEITLPDLQGNMVSLSSLRGKVVIIDFWGSWCGWCIKGFPKLKETYAANRDKLEVFGVDCGDSPEAWRAAVAKYELPWVNVQDTEQGTATSAYAVEGFPTKLIIDAEGIIRNVTVGENPEFFNILSTLLP